MNIVYFLAGGIVGFIVGAVWHFLYAKKKASKADEVVQFADVPLPHGEDPLKQIDELMAHGRYKESEAIIRTAIKTYSDRNDLKGKLLEILYVNGDEDQFLELARDYEQSLLGTSIWRRVCSMGAQMCPNEALFREETREAS